MLQRKNGAKRGAFARDAYRLLRDGRTVVARGRTGIFKVAVRGAPTSLLQKILERKLGVELIHRVIGTQHVYTSRQVPELFSAHTNQRIALKNVAPSLTAIREIKQDQAQRSDSRVPA